MTVKIGKEAFYRQLEMPLAEAYRYTSDVMVENMLARGRRRRHLGLHRETRSEMGRSLTRPR